MFNINALNIADYDEENADWIYETSDTFDEVEEPGYFNSAREILEYDFIKVKMKTGDDETIRMYMFEFDDDDNFTLSVENTINCKTVKVE